MFAILVYLPMQMQWQKGLSASASGEIMVIFMISITLGAYCGGKLVNKSGEYKRYALFGFFLAAVSFAMIQNHLFPAVALGLSGLGIGFTLPALGVVVQNVLPPKDRGIGMSLFNFGRELGGAIGVAACSTVFQLSLNHNGVAKESSLADYSPQALASGFNSIYLLMAVMALIAMFITLFALKKQTLATEIDQD